MNPSAPIAKKEEEIKVYHDTKYVDDYYWLRDKDNPEVIAYLEAENAYTESVMGDTADLQAVLYEEMRGKIKEDDVSAPVKIDDYFYYTRTEKDREYALYCRKKGSLDSEEEVLLDHNELAKGMSHCSLGVFSVSPDHKLLAYSTDTDGSERYTIFIKELKTGEIRSERIENTSYSFVWRNDSASFIYATLDATLRPHRANLHILTQDIQDDVLLYEEPDERFSLSLSRSKSKRFIFIELESKVTSETHFIDQESEKQSLSIIHPREYDHLYSVEHHGDSFLICTNDNAKNFKLMRTSIESPGKRNWTEFIPEKETVSLDGFEVFSGHLCLYELREGIVDIRVRNMTTGVDEVVSFAEEIYSLSSGSNPNFESSTLRFVYSSLVTPQSVFDYDMESGERVLVKQKEVPGGFDSSQYVTRRMYATAEDGTNIPISLAYRKDTDLSEGVPCLLSGYGSYGLVHPVSFNPHKITLLDRGFVYAIAHIRGGGENGRTWYEEGKYLKKKNTFTDYIAVAEALIKEGLTTKEKLIGAGGSAGGMLIGYVANTRPDLFKGLVANVPFVDIVNTMMDPTIPLTVIEYEEWGNPNDKEYFDYIQSYSPYDNVRAQAYPHMLVTAGLNDPRVHYWEPAKWVAKLRALKTGKNLLLLKTEMDHGHSGATGRYAYLKEVAFDFAFILKILGTDYNRK